MSIVTFGNAARSANAVAFYNNSGMNLAPGFLHGGTFFVNSYKYLTFNYLDSVLSHTHFRSDNLYSVNSDGVSPYLNDIEELANLLVNGQLIAYSATQGVSGDGLSSPHKMGDDHNFASGSATQFASGGNAGHEAGYSQGYVAQGFQGNASTQFASGGGPGMAPSVPGKKKGFSTHSGLASSAFGHGNESFQGGPGMAQFPEGDSREGLQGNQGVDPYAREDGSEFFPSGPRHPYPQGDIGQGREGFPLGPGPYAQGDMRDSIKDKSGDKKGPFNHHLGAPYPQGDIGQGREGFIGGPGMVSGDKKGLSKHGAGLSLGYGSSFFTLGSALASSVLGDGSVIFD
jgi:hypothetical protein